MLSNGSACTGGKVFFSIRLDLHAGTSGQNNLSGAKPNRNPNLNPNLNPKLS
jgi:hypothetical protein